MSDLTTCICQVLFQLSISWSQTQPLAISEDRPWKLAGEECRVPLIATQTSIPDSERLERLKISDRAKKHRPGFIPLVPETEPAAERIDGLLEQLGVGKRFGIRQCESQK